jgi:hypothetical protein
MTDSVAADRDKEASGRDCRPRGRKEDYAIRDKYEGLSFDRSLKGPSATSRVLGVGHRLFDAALADAEAAPVSVAVATGLDAPLLIASVEDEVTGTGASIRRIIVGVTRVSGQVVVLRDWELLLRLNKLAARSGGDNAPADGERFDAVVRELKSVLNTQLKAQVPSMYRPATWPEILLLPSASQ